MFKHVVFFRLKENSKENCEELVNALLSMRGKINVAKSINAGMDLVRSERSFDAVLEIELEKEGDLDLYQNHHCHKEILEKTIKKLVKESVTVDYIVDIA